jgi:hypothetical protein
VPLCFYSKESTVLTEEEAAVRVAAGVRWMGGHAPVGWENLVNLDEFDMGDSNWCVLGQVFAWNTNGASGYGHAVYNVMDGDTDTARSLGFLAANSGDYQADTQVLERAWRDYLAGAQLVVAGSV